MALVLSILVLACIALVVGAIALLRRGGQDRHNRKQAGLMLLLAVIMAVNVAICTDDDDSVESTINDAETNPRIGLVAQLSF